MVFGTSLESLYPLGNGRSLHYLFDYGDHWLFKFTKCRTRPFAPVKGVSTRACFLSLVRHQVPVDGTVSAGDAHPGRPAALKGSQRPGGDHRQPRKFKGAEVAGYERQVVNQRVAASKLSMAGKGLPARATK